MTDDQVPIRQYIEALLNEQQRATEIAERERGKAAEALFGESRRASEIAEQERAKAAGALAMGLQQSIKAGDERLHEHIEGQVRQIDAALASSEKLALQRVATLEEGLAAMGRSMVDRFDYTEAAVSKAETANDKRFDGINAFRAELADRYQTTMPREVAEAQMNEIRKQLAQVTTRLDTATGKSQGTNATIATMIAMATFVVSVVVLLASNQI